ncbi:DUF4124 domain-containing protein [Marinobacter salarius]|uniref:DUF4124 domain-containing protein n=1 Tax=Marinobacter salarius TaxID=1420917 RepID=UPI003BA9F3FB
MRLILVFLIALSFPAVGQVYKWTDAQGNVHFGTQPPPGQNDEVKIRDSSPGSMAAPERPAKDDTDPPKESPRAKLNQLESAARDRACDLAKSELASAERKLTLALSIDQNSPMADYRENQVDLWKRRTRIECIGAQ